MIRTLCLAIATIVSVALASCAKSTDDHAGHNHAAAKHEHKAPHGGTPVVLGAEVYHLELVRDPAAGRLTAYVLDGEMENFIRVKTPSFTVAVGAGAAKRTLIFRAIANSATGETVGDTSQFEAEADWLKTEGSFDATLDALEIRGTKFENVAFNFPKGNDND